MSEGKNKKSSKRLSYKDSGVDIDLASDTLESVKDHISSTFTENVISDLSAFAGLFKLDISGYDEPVLVSSTDGVGTKLLIARQSGNFEGLGQDLVAMCINDIVCCGAKPLFFLDYIATGKIDPPIIKKIIKGIADSCRKTGTALIGGETAEMPGLYSANDFDLAGFSVGIVDKSKIITDKRPEEGDLIIGLGSSGLHSNGFSLVRKIIEKEGLGLKKRYISGDKRSLSEILLEPTRLYSPIIDSLIESGLKINGIANITGGGFYDNISRILPAGLDAEIDITSYEVPRIFEFLKKSGSIDTKEMYRVFNMGIGMVIIIPEAQYGYLNKVSEKIGEDLYDLGKLKKGSGGVILTGREGQVL